MLRGFLDNTLLDVAAAGAALVALMTFVYWARAAWFRAKAVMLSWQLQAERNAAELADWREARAQLDASPAARTSCSVVPLSEVDSVHTRTPNGGRSWFDP